MVHHTRQIGVFRYVLNMAVIAGIIAGVAALIVYLLIREDMLHVRREVAQASRAEVPALATGAIIAAEDPEFYRHPRFYTLSAALAQPRRASLTMHLVRSRLGGRGLWNAVRELLIATAIDAFDSKETIARAYAATVYLGMPKGEPVYGVQSASPVYFGKPAGSLTPAQAATLAAAVRSPSVFSPLVSSEEAIKRRVAVLESMRDSGVIDGAEFDKAKTSVQRATPAAIP